MLVALEVCIPFDDYQEVHVAKHCQEHDHLGKEDVPELVPLFEVDVVQGPHYETHGHVSDSEDHGYLHFHRVQEGDFIGAGVPGGINTELVHAGVGVGACGGLSVASFDVVTCSEEVQWDGTEVIVEKTAIRREDTHK